jgi:two-component sensor histidine kinase
MRWTPYILTAILAWLAILGVISAMPVLSGVTTWERSLADAVTQWLPWVILSPGIFWFAVRFPMGRMGFGWRLGLHLAAGLLLIVFATWASDRCLAPQMMTLVPALNEPNGHPPPVGPPGDHFPGPMPPPRGPFHDHGPHGPPFWARAWFNVPIYLSLISLSHAFIYFRRSQQRDRRAVELAVQLDRARLQALRMQLQPHFLFNTLNAISTLIQTNPRVAQEMVGSLGQMLRLSLDSGSQAEVPLEQELKFLDSYLEIAQIRFGNRLKVNQHINPKTLKALVPTFILQPLVENAIQHGIEPDSAQGTVEICAEQTADQLTLSVSDTGIGLTETFDEAAIKGIGLANTRARLQSLYPGQYNFTIRNRAKGGCLAELKIPLHTTPSTGDVSTNRS